MADMSKEELMQYLREHPEELVRMAARDDFTTFARYLNPKLEMSPLHTVYYRVLDLFAHGRIRRLIVSMQPQAGKSEGSSRTLPQFLLGLDPDCKIAIGSYAAAISQGFNRDVQRGMASAQYRSLFPDSRINFDRSRTAGTYQCNANVTEIIGRRGFVKAVGRGGPLTGTPVDVAILDDVYKDFNEANSATVREAAWKWYTTVVRTRLHRDSREIIVFTRWHEDDIIGRLEKSGEDIRVAKTWKDLENVPAKTWLLINFPALKVGAPTELDPRNEGEAFWPSRHPVEELLERKRIDPNQFECLYQGDPGSAEGRLYHEWRTYSDKREWGRVIRKGNYTDVADRGNDFLASICYDVVLSDQRIYNEKTHRYEPLLFALITDIEYTQADTDTTYHTVPAMMNRNGTQKAWVESNAGGSQFERNISTRTKAITEPFAQHGNKEARIISNAAEVNSRIIFPMGWKERWPKVAEHLERFLRYFKGNTHDDIEDALTGVYEKEIATGNTRPYGQRRGIRRRN